MWEDWWEHLVISATKRYIEETSSDKMMDDNENILPGRDNVQKV